MSESSPTIKRLNRFPIKGMTAEPLTSVTLSAGEGIPGDRLYGFARYNSGFNPENPQPLPKQRFVVLANEAKLAGLTSHFNQDSLQLDIIVNEQTHHFDMTTPDGCKRAELFLHTTLSLSDKEPPVFVSSSPHRFTDVSVDSVEMMNAISVLNLASVRELEKMIDAEIDPARFRANIEIDGLPPFAELEAVGTTLSFDGVEMKIVARTQRCAATEVNPASAERDVKIPYLINQNLGHADMGVYASVMSGGELSVGQSGIHIIQTNNERG